MKLRTRFILFFVFGLIAFIVFMGVFVALFIEYFIPVITNNADIISVLEISAMIIPFLLGSVFLGLFFVSPLINMISLIRKLSIGTYQLEETNNKLYKQNGKLKTRYFLYYELIADIFALAENLKLAEKERKQLEDAKTNWIAGVSHDLKTPLSYVTGYSSLLLEKDKQWTLEEQQKFLFEIHAKSVDIKDLIDDMNLSFKFDSLGESFPLALEETDMVDLTKIILADIAGNPTADGFEFSFESTSPQIMITVDRRLIKRSMQNVLMNAVIHNPKGTNIEVDIKSNNANEVIISIEDNGVGMEEIQIARLFKRYQQVGYSKDMTGGLGLSVTKSILEAHGGTVRLESCKGVGTKVDLIFSNQNSKSVERH